MMKNEYFNRAIQTYGTPKCVMHPLQLQRPNFKTQTVSMRLDLKPAVPSLKINQDQEE